MSETNTSRTIKEEAVTIYEDAESQPEGLVKVIQYVLCTPVVSTILLLISVILACVEVIMGGVFLRSCPRDIFIPVYWIVAGCLMFFTPLIKLCYTDDVTTCKGYWMYRVFYAVTTSNLGWFLVGSFWIYYQRGRYQSTDPSAWDYCHNGFYWFSFILQTLLNIAACVGALFGLLWWAACCCACVRAVKQEQQQQKINSQNNSNSSSSSSSNNDDDPQIRDTYHL